MTLDTDQESTADAVSAGVSPADKLRAVGDADFLDLYAPERVEALAILEIGDPVAYEKLMRDWQAKRNDTRKLRGVVTRKRKEVEKKQRDERASSGDNGEAGNPFDAALGDAELWRDQRGQPYATVKVVDDDSAEHLEHMNVDGRAFGDWLGRQYWVLTGFPPPDKEFREFVRSVRGRAIYGGAKHDTWIRWATHEDKLYVDLADEAWQVIEIDATGWRVCTDPPVRFRRSGTERPLPFPVRADSARTIETLERLLNLRRPEHLKLILGFMVGAMRPGRPCCILLFLCEPGSAKTTVLRIVCGAIDPREAQEAGKPPSEWDMAVVAHQGWLVSWDNIGKLDENEANAICRIVTGGGHQKRGLYTDESVHAMALQRPVVMTALSMPTARSDFVDRSVAVELGVIDERKRLAEDTVQPMVRELQPALFGLLLDAASCALRNKDAVRKRLEGQRLPRMADFAIWAEAAGEAFGWKPGEFLDEYMAVLSQRMGEAAENDPLCEALVEMVRDDDCGSVEGKAGDLLAMLRRHVERHWSMDKRGRSPADGNWFPRTARALATQLELNRRPLEALGLVWSKRPDPHSRTAGSVHSLELTADALADNQGPSERKKVDEAESFIIEQVKDHAVPAAEMMSRCLNAGFSERTTLRAKKNMEIASFQQGGQWYWDLEKPEDDDRGRR